MQVFVFVGLDSCTKFLGTTRTFSRNICVVFKFDHLLGALSVIFLFFLVFECGIQLFFQMLYDYRVPSLFLKYVWLHMCLA